MRTQKMRYERSIEGEYYVLGNVCHGDELRDFREARLLDRVYTEANPKGSRTWLCSEYKDGKLSFSTQMDNPNRAFKWVKDFLI
jgi:hypothetical protein